MRLVKMFIVMLMMAMKIRMMVITMSMLLLLLMVNMMIQRKMTPLSLNDSIVAISQICFPPSLQRSHFSSWQSTCKLASWQFGNLTNLKSYAVSITNIEVVK